MGLTWLDRLASFLQGCASLLLRRRPSSAWRRRSWVQWPEWPYWDARVNDARLEEWLIREAGPAGRLRFRSHCVRTATGYDIYYDCVNGMVTAVIKNTQLGAAATCNVWVGDRDLSGQRRSVDVAKVVRLIASHN